MKVQDLSDETMHGRNPGPEALVHKLPKITQLSKPLCLAYATWMALKYHKLNVPSPEEIAEIYRGSGSTWIYAISKYARSFGCKTSTGDYITKKVMKWANSPSEGGFDIPIISTVGFNSLIPFGLEKSTEPHAVVITGLKNNKVQFVNPWPAVFSIYSYMDADRYIENASSTDHGYIAIAAPGR